LGALSPLEARMGARPRRACGGARAPQSAHPRVAVHWAVLQADDSIHGGRQLLERVIGQVKVLLAYGGFGETGTHRGVQVERWRRLQRPLHRWDFCCRLQLGLSRALKPWSRGSLFPGQWNGPSPGKSPLTAAAPALGAGLTALGHSGGALRQHLASQRRGWRNPTRTFQLAASSLRMQTRAGARQRQRSANRPRTWVQGQLSAMRTVSALEGSQHTTFCSPTASAVLPGQGLRLDRFARRVGALPICVGVSLRTRVRAHTCVSTGTRARRIGVAASDAPRVKCGQTRPKHTHPSRSPALLVGDVRVDRWEVGPEAVPLVRVVDNLDGLPLVVCRPARVWQSRHA
jgi:hypothetical protein